MQVEEVQLAGVTTASYHASQVSFGVVIQVLRHMTQRLSVKPEEHSGMHTCTYPHGSERWKHG